MSQPGDVERMFLQCTPGLEGALEAEARVLGRAHQISGGVVVDGAAGQYAQAALVLRLAERILLRIFESSVVSWAQVEAGLRSVSLAGVAEPGAPVVVEATLRVSGAPTVGTLPGLLGRVWGREVRRASGEDRGGRGVRLVLRVVDGTASLSADVGGTLLHRRGWRQEVSRAPLRETLAAGVLALASHSSEVPVWDPVCGSGTLVIEAALIARGVPPGLGRSFAAEAWPGAAQVDWAGRRELLRAGVRPRAPAAIVGSDLNAGALGTARRNARRAGVLEDLRLERVDVAALQPGALAPGLLVGNLPYGVRVNARGGLDSFDSALAGALTGPFRTWRRALLVDDPARLSRAGGRTPDRVHRLLNGGIPVVLGIWEGDRAPA